MFCWVPASKAILVVAVFYVGHFALNMGIAAARREFQKPVKGGNWHTEQNTRKERKGENMDCPACGRMLQQIEVGDVTVDACQSGCAGIWFDNFELDKVDESHEAAGEPLLDVARDEAIAVDMTQRRHCPKCKNIVMLRHYFGVAQDVEIDECGGCGGIWLDHGELARIRGRYASAEDRDQAEREYMAGFQKQLQSMRAESEQKAESAKRFARMFRFICPSHYIPGQQDWGAF